MIDIKLIRENPEIVKENIKKKFQDYKLPLVDEIKSLDEKWRKNKVSMDSLRHERNSISEDVRKAKVAKDEKKAKELIKKAQKLLDDLAKLEETNSKLEGEIREKMLKVPNIMHSSVPIGKDSSQNVERLVVGEPKVPKYEIFNHAELAERIGGVDFDTSRETSGNGFFFLKGKLAELSAAMLAYARDYMIKQGFEYVEPPLLIRRKVVEGVMSFAEMEAMMYKIEGEDLYLIGTSEHPLIGLFMDKTLRKENLPYKLTGFSSCFRKEIGAHGIEEKGFYRRHQFNKQEMVVVCEPEESYQWYDKMLKCTLAVFKALNVPVRVMECCSGDLADLKAKSCDVEGWSPRQKKYYELGSLTNMEAAQARRLNIKVASKEGNYFAHTLNNTVLASPRALIAVMENNQKKDGSITIPKALRPYMGGVEEIPIKK